MNKKLKSNNPEFSQPVLNIGMVGHVDHGKTTLLEKLSGKWTDTHSEEVKRGITIRLGYADIAIYNCSDHGYSIKKQCDKCEIQRVISFIDAPGHETLMATMLSGSAIMDGALLMVAANEECPQPQTREHLMALEILGIKNIIIIQNKVDTVPKDEAIKNYNKIKEFTKGTIAENAPIIPISAKYNINIAKIYEAIETLIKTPERDITKDPIMLVARSFDINRPGANLKEMKGGILGGSLKQGTLKLHDKIEISPGRLVQEKGAEKWVPIITEITAIVTAQNQVESVIPGGSIAMQTKLDPSIVKADQLAGSIVGLVGKVPKLWYELKIKPNLLERVLGTKEDTKVEAIKKGEPLMLNVNAMTTAGIVVNLEKNKLHIKLKKPICADADNKIAISRRIGNRWHLVGWAFVDN
jgi:translation initiation factor 2 subunit 3